MKNERFWYKFETMSTNENASKPVQEESLSPRETFNPFVDILVSKPVQDPAQDTVQTKLQTPPSFPRPPESCFIKQYAPPAPECLQLHFYTSKTLAEIFAEMEVFLKDTDFITNTSSWYGKVNPGEYECECRISVYKNKTDSRYIIEAHRLTRGDGFAFGEFYNNLKKALA